MDPNHETMSTLRVQKCFIQCLGTSLCAQVTFSNLANLIPDLKQKSNVGNKVCKCLFFKYRDAPKYSCRSNKQKE